MSKKKTEISVLLPILSKQETKKEFLDSIPAEAKDIFLLLVIDTELMVGQFGFAASDIATGNALMQELKTTLGKKGRKCTEMEEWGNTERKIMQIAQLKQVDKIFLVKQNNEFYMKLIKSLNEGLKIPIEEISLPEPEKK